MCCKEIHFGYLVYVLQCGNACEMVSVDGGGLLEKVT